MLVTAGPTYEAIDPVRFIGNHASGKMGFALAEALAKRGASVVLISGPTALTLQHENLSYFSVSSAAEMLAVVQEHWNTCDIGIFAAAVADYRPENKQEQKIKKQADQMQITLVKNPDILAWCGSNKTNMQRTIGFALETENGEVNAKEKLVRKKADAIILNTMEENEKCFNSDTNKVRIFDVKGKSIDLAKASKTEIANQILDYLSAL